MSTPVRIAFLSCAALVIGGLVACATTPTGRKQLRLVPASTMEALGVQSFEQIKQEEPISQDPAANRYVRCLADALIAELPAKWRRKQWEVVVFDSDTVNAFALPGGRIGVYRGIMEVADAPEQLAAVMGHEIGHVLANHGNERVSQGLVAQGVMVSASVLTAGNPRTQQAVLAGLGLGAQVGVLLPFSRKHESEADLIGMDLMAEAGFDPHGAVQLWRNMAARSKGQPPQFLSTHPSHQTRIQALQKHLSVAVPKYESARSRGRRPACVPPR
ncbi:MAG: M48 family peptidase [Candidatus Dadabacteria bacterium]|nr:MAG: M48 family peptidase [Candidatus Dadabacteria bacterium]